MSFSKNYKEFLYRFPFLQQFSPKCPNCSIKWNKMIGSWILLFEYVVLMKKILVKKLTTDKLTTNRQDKNNMPPIIRSGGINK